MRVALGCLEVDRNRERPAITFARVKRWQELFDQKRLDGIWLQIVIGLDARARKAGERQCRFGFLHLAKLLEWRVAIKAFFENKLPQPLVSRADDFNAIKIVEEHQATNALVEFVPGLQ